MPHRLVCGHGCFGRAVPWRVTHGVRCGSDAGWVPYTVCGVLYAGSCPYPPLSIMFELNAAGWRVLGCCVT